MNTTTQLTQLFHLVKSKDSVLKAQLTDGLRVYLNRGRHVNPILRFASFLERHARMTFSQAGNDYFCLTAIAEISIRALLTKAAAWTVARAGFGSGITLL